RQTDRRFAIEAEHRLRRIGIAHRNRRHIGEAKELAVCKEIDALQIVDRVERAGNANREFFLLGLHDPGRRHSVLLAQALNDLVTVDAESGELTGIEFEVEFLVLGAEQLRLCRILYGEDFGTDVFNIITQLAVREAIGGERVDNAEDVAELVIEIGSDDPLRQCPFDVGDLLAYLVPDIRDLVLWRIVEYVDIDRRYTGLGLALEVVQPRRLLQFLFDPVGDLQHRVVDGGTRPIGLHEHRLDRKARIFLAPELDIGENAGN